MTTTIAKDISKDTVAVIMENKDRYPGVDVEEDSIRVYEDGLYMAPLIGYTGQVSAEELEELNGENGNGQYSSSDIVGKSGLEKYFEKELRGQNGTKTVYVDNLGKVLKEDSEVAPQAEMISILPLTAIFRLQYIRFWSSILPELYTIRFLMPRNLIKTVFHQRMIS